MGWEAEGRLWCRAGGSAGRTWEELELRLRMGIRRENRRGSEKAVCSANCWLWTDGRATASPWLPSWLWRDEGEDGAAAEHAAAEDRGWEAASEAEEEREGAGWRVVVVVVVEVEEEEARSGLLLRCEGDEERAGGGVGGDGGEEEEEDGIELEEESEARRGRETDIDLGRRGQREREQRCVGGHG